jgi:hypothetical protein
MAFKVNSKSTRPNKPSLSSRALLENPIEATNDAPRAGSLSESREKALVKLNNSLPKISQRPLPRGLGDKLSDNLIEILLGLVCLSLLLVIILAIIPLASLLIPLALASFTMFIVVIVSNKNCKRITSAVKRENQESVEECWREFAGRLLDRAPVNPRDGFEILHADKRNIVSGDKVMVEFFPSIVSFNEYEGWRYRSIDEKDSIAPYEEDPRLDAKLLLKASLIPGYGIADVKEIVSLPSRFDSEEFDLLAEGWADYCAAIDSLNERRWARLQEAEITANFQKELVSEKLGTLELLPEHKS